MAKVDRIVLYRTETASSVPSAGDLVRGELAVNLPDKKLYVKDHLDAVVELTTPWSGVTPTSTNTLTNKSISLATNTVTTTLAQLNTAVSDATLAPDYVQADIESTTTYTVLAADHGRTKRFTNATSIDVTIPTGLPAGFWCSLFAEGAALTITTTGLTLLGSTPNSSIAQNEILYVEHAGAENYIVAGGTSE